MNLECQIHSRWSGIKPPMRCCVELYARNSSSRSLPLFGSRCRHNSQEMRRRNSHSLVSVETMPRAKSQERDKKRCFRSNIFLETIDVPDGKRTYNREACPIFCGSSQVGHVMYRRFRQSIKSDWLGLGKTEAILPNYEHPAARQWFLPDTQICDWSVCSSYNVLEMSAKYWIVSSEK